MVLDIKKLEKDLNTGNSVLIEGYTVTKDSKDMYKVNKNNYSKKYFDLESVLDFIYG